MSDTLTAASRDFGQMWPTPQAGTPAQNGNSEAGNSDFSRRAMELAALMWGTPTANERAQTPRAVDHGVQLANQVQQWPTPAARDYKGANSTDHVTTNGTGRMHMDQLPNFVEHSFHPSLPGPPTPDGPLSSPERRSLNPLFVEWLMGWPTGLSGFERAETAWSRWLPLMRGCLSALVSSRTAEPEQGRLL